MSKIEKRLTIFALVFVVIYLGAAAITVHQRITKEEKIEKGRTVRIDCTCVETHIHAPTDSTLLWDAVRVLTRLIDRGGIALGMTPGQVGGMITAPLLSLFVVPAIYLQWKRRYLH